ncbi:IS3 family transposase [Kocuria sp. CPCC 205235]|uniref:IS3 family transposase n=1 Tax=unclassified Kocuria TaxID=2649579 RepID=UPI0034D4CB19
MPGSTRTITCVYGARKIWHAMAREGWQIGGDQCARLMRKAGLVGVVRGRCPRTTVVSKAADARGGSGQSVFYRHRAEPVVGC